MAKLGDDDFDEFDLADNDEELEYGGGHEEKHHARQVRRELDRRLELRRLRELLDDYDLNDFE